MKLLRTYGFSLLLIGSIAVGVAVGKASPSAANALRPIGELFLNLIFMAIVPLVFFTVSSSIASMGAAKQLSRLSGATAFVFLLTSVTAGLASLLFFLVVQPTPGAGLVLAKVDPGAAPPLLGQVVRAFTVGDFAELLSKKSMLPLIVFSVAVGVATLQLGPKGDPFARVLASSAEVFGKIVGYVMVVAPIGLLAWFAATVVDTGEKLVGAYADVFAAYYVFAALYFVVGFSGYAWVAGRGPAVRRFWAHALAPSLTALGTCSSMATMPVNRDAATRMGIPRDVADLAIPLGAALHKDGSVIGGVLKVLFAMSLFHVPLGAPKLVIAVVVAVLVGVVMGAIPSGGMIGELLILSVFGFPAEVLPLLAIVSVLIDPAATLLNATGDTAAAMVVTRVTHGAAWCETPAALTEVSA